MVAGRSDSRVKIIFEGNKIEQLEDFKFLELIQMTDGNCCHCIKEIKRIAIAKENAAKLLNIIMDIEESHMAVESAFHQSTYMANVPMWFRELDYISTDDANRISSFEMYCWRKMMGV